MIDRITDLQGRDVEILPEELERATAGIQAMHIERPDEAVMRAEELPAMTDEVDGVERQEALNALFAELLRLPRFSRQMGWAVYALCWEWCPGLLPVSLHKVGKQERAAMIRAGVLPLGDVHPATVVQVLRFVVGDHDRWCDVVKIGQRALCFAFLFAPATIKNGRLSNMTRLGYLYGTSACNPRSTAQAAVDRMRGELVDYYVRTGGRREDVVVPGGKSEQSRRRYQTAQMGNRNKAESVRRAQATE